MKCPHCLENFHGTYSMMEEVNDAHANYVVGYVKCPACRRASLAFFSGRGGNYRIAPLRLIHPPIVSRKPLPSEVPDSFSGDYKEACLVLADSPKASAALSRRCLQHVLRECANTKGKDLAPQIDEVIPHLPSYVAETLHEVRTIGNFAAHPTKSTNTGEIIDVEPQEAEWLLEALEALFDHYFVKPAEAKKRRDAINAKQSEAGKQPLK